MSNGTKLLLFLGCALVMALEAPHALSALSDGWSGPYVRNDPAPPRLPEIRPVTASHILEHPVSRFGRRFDFARR